MDWRPWGLLFAALLCLLQMGVLSSASPTQHHRRRHRARARCFRCPPGWGVISECTGNEDTACARCPSGHYSPHHSFRLSCWVCSRCGPGLYEARACTSRQDTVCDDCERARNDVHAKHNTDFLNKCLQMSNSINSIRTDR